MVVSDGEATATTDLISFAEVGERVQAAVVLGYGTPEGGVMPLRARRGRGQRRDVAAGPLVTDPQTAAPAVSRLDAGAFKVARELGGTYVHPDASQDLTAPPRRWWLRRTPTSPRRAAA